MQHAPRERPGLAGSLRWFQGMKLTRCTSAGSAPHAAGPDREEHTMSRIARNARGFSVQEMVVGLATLGLFVACTAPAFVRYRESHALEGATDTVVSQIRMARSMALRTGVDQRIAFETDSKGAIFKAMNPDGSTRAIARLPNTVMYDASTSHKLTLQKNGRADRNGTVVLCDYSGKCDTVSVEPSGFVISH
jgi:Tfp pilus assembly protein FimT